MIATATSPVTISIDLKKSRIRIHKSLLHAMGNPKYIQLLVHPNNKFVAIHAIDKSEPGDQSERITPLDMMAENSFELYSKAFINKLCELIEGLNPECTYRLYGKIVTSHNMAVFPLNTITPVET